MIAGMPVATPPGSNSDQNKRRDRDSPGYGDLGVRHFSSTNSGLNASSVDTNPDPFIGQRTASRSSLDAAPRYGGSQGSLGSATRNPQPISLPLSGNPYNVIHHQAVAPMQQQQFLPPQQQQQQRQQPQQQFPSDWNIGQHQAAVGQAAPTLTNTNPGSPEEKPLFQGVPDTSV